MRDENRDLQEPYILAYDHAQATADATVKLDKVPPGKTLRIDSVQYINVTGLAQDPANYFTIKVTDGTNIVASWSTQTTAGQGSVPANTFVTLVLGTGGNPVLVAGEVLTLFLDETGDTTLPAGRIVIRGRYI